MTITIQLDGPKLNILENEAANLGVAPEQWAEAIIHRQLERRPIANDDAFRKAMDDTFRENEELYRRLAK